MSLYSIILTEGINDDVLYHFTRENLIIRILESNRLEVSDNYNTVSLTRNFDLETFGNVRLTLDKKKLSQNYSISPFYYDVSDGRNEKRPRNPLVDTEREEVIKKDINNLDKYLIQIDIYQGTNRWLSEQAKETYNKIIQLKPNIKVNLVENFKPYKS